VARGSEREGTGGVTRLYGKMGWKALWLGGIKGKGEGNGTNRHLWKKSWGWTTPLGLNKEILK